MVAAVTGDVNGASDTLEAIDILPDAADAGELPGAGDVRDLQKTPAAAVIHRVIARDGLVLRGGPGTEFPVRRSLPYGTQVNILKREGQWALIDLQGDGPQMGTSSPHFSTVARYRLHSR